MLQLCTTNDSQLTDIHYNKTLLKNACLFDKIDPCEVAKSLYSFFQIFFLT